MRLRLRCRGPGLATRTLWVVLPLAVGLTLPVVIAPAGAQEVPAPGERPAVAVHEVERWPPVATFSIVGYDTESGVGGGGVQSRVFSVGNGVLLACLVFTSPRKRARTR